jgi:hypothetical protein
LPVSGVSWLDPSKALGEVFITDDGSKEAVKGVGFDLLLVCGFAFDAASPETAQEFRPDTVRNGQ